MLRLLLDENISPEVAVQAASKHSEIVIESLHSWRNGNLRGQPDERILAAAMEESWTLVTYDQKTILPLLARWGLAEQAHAGVIFVDNRTIAANDTGTMMRALIAVWEAGSAEDWTNATAYLRPPD